MPVRIIPIQRHLVGQTVADVLHGELRLGRGIILQYMREKKVHLSGHLCQTPGRRVRPGQRLEIVLKEPSKKKELARKKEPAGLRRATRREDARYEGIRHDVRVRFMDAHIVVVDKPAGLTTVRHASEVEEVGRRAQKYLPPTLVDVLPSFLPAKDRAGRQRAVHRLDKETTGLVVFARTSAAETHLGLQFRAHSIQREYLALVRGKAKNERIETHLVRDRGDGRRGSGLTDEGQKAVTNIKIVETLGDFTLVSCILETGRTHQVRIHLGERGTPLCGERVYDRPLNGKPVPDTSGAGRPLLHAAFLSFDHPETGQRLSWKAKLPKDMDETLRKLRYRNKKRAEEPKPSGD
jgi:23S rRNA pseudouridine1911/1915/1917 synthase